MSIIGYSPWQDAAQVGKGIGDALGTILFKLPMLEAENRRENRRLDIAERQQQSAGELQQTRSDMLKMQLEMYPELTRLKQENTQMGNAIRMMQAQASMTRAQSGAENTQSLIADRQVDNQRADRTLEATQTQRGVDNARKDRQTDINQQNANTQQGLANLGMTQFFEDRGAKGMVIPPPSNAVPFSPKPAIAPPAKQEAGGIGNVITNILQMFRGGTQQYNPQELEAYSRGQLPMTTQGQPGLPEGVDMASPQEQFMQTDFSKVLQKDAAAVMDEAGISTDAGPASGSKVGRAYGNRQMNTPPSPTHNIMIQDEATGKMFWTDKVGAQQRVGKGFRIVE